MSFLLWRGTMKEKMYWLEYQSDGVFLVIKPFSGSLQEKIKEVFEYINRKEVENYDVEAIVQAIKMDKKQKVKIAELQEEKPIDESVNVYTSAGDMEAFIELLPPDGGRILTVDDIISKLQEEGIVYGINKNKIEELCSNRQYNKKILVATGSSPVEGKDAELEFHVNLYKQPKPRLNEDGSVDYRSLDAIELVTKGDKLVTLIPPQEGIEGRTVTGRVLKPKAVKYKALPKGKNTEISKDNLSLIALESGKVEIVNGKVTVKTVYEIRGDVDFSVGNIEFQGDVIVHGNVSAGFTINAGGSIEVRGVVEGAYLFAEKDIILKRGFRGLGKGTMDAKGDVVARFLENGTVNAKGSVKAEVILQSQIQCGDEVIVSGKKGLISGGSVSATNRISAITVGSPLATPTVLQIGVDPFTKQEYADLEAELKELKSEEEKLLQAYEVLKRLEQLGRLTMDKQIIKEKVEQRLPEVINSIRQKEEQLRKLTTAQSAVNGNINVMKVIYPGTDLVIGNVVKKIKDPIKYATFKKTDDGIVYVSFEG